MIEIQGLETDDDVFVGHSSENADSQKFIDIAEHYLQLVKHNKSDLQQDVKVKELIKGIKIFREIKHMECEPIAII